MLLRAFAKINWTLDITGTLEDGYHYMDMLMQPVSLADEITLLPAERLLFTAEGDPAIPLDETNLAVRAVRALERETSRPLPCSIHIRKRIPSGAGMAGGSADAAAVLIGVNRFFGLGLDMETLCRIGLGLGADVPFCLRGGLVRTRGIGEQLDVQETSPVYPLVILKPEGSLRTGDIFRAWEALKHPSAPRNDDALAALKSGTVRASADAFANVLQPAAESFLPEIRDAVADLKKEGAFLSLMTGSGSAVFGLFSTARDAESAAGRLSARWQKVYPCESQPESVQFGKDAAPETEEIVP